MIYKILLHYLILINLYAIFVTVYDKVAAIKSKRRISERALLLTSLLGGSVMMYITMLLIRHKTKKPKFMITIPLIVALQIALAIFVMVNV